MIIHINDLERSVKLRFILTIAGLGFFFQISSIHSQQRDFTRNFEEGQLIGWYKDNDDTSNAFYYQPTKGDNPTERQRGQPSNHQGEFWIGTYEKFQGKDSQNAGDIQEDEPQGVLSTLDFIIPEGPLSFLVGGGSSPETRVELLVYDDIESEFRSVLSASGNDVETMQRVSWDITKYTGKRGRLRIVDQSSAGWGHINVDDFIFGQVPLPEEPEVQDQSPPPPPPESELEYKIILDTDRGILEPGQAVNFKSYLEPSNENVEYRFTFGDGNFSDWSPQPTAQHTYLAPGEYQAYVESRIDPQWLRNHHSLYQGIIAQSDPINIGVVLPPPPQSSGGIGRPLLIGGLVIALVLGYVLIARLKKQRKAKKDSPSEIRIEINKENGNQQIESPNPVKSDFEMRLRPIIDPGVQEIIGDIPLIINERKVLQDE